MARDQGYGTAVVKGIQLLQLLLSNTTNATRHSALTDEKELARHGYERQDNAHFKIDCIREALRGLDVDDKLVNNGGKNEIVYYIHNRDSVVNGVEYPMTTAYFNQISNPASGILIADTNITPSHAGRLLDNPIETYPPLSHWSDVAFLQYLGPRPLPLRFVVRISIQNVEMYRVLHKSEEGRAILGTPHGSGVAWMLIQHQKHLGVRRLEKVMVFYAPKEGDLWRWPSLLFWIA
ncbi:hypothetical protein BDW02DRAFT_639576 [Decorospora gaudefroyi]|uniref:Uncharacterized protein n=1 Tax=Decorospora gaudefroyi TaxID=184978 RepID=A0A6A5KEN3_9PLEO|nr:hypothetical protein BDW02DRAFT_639576 [Decorospora gaudefroyi]